MYILEKEKKIRGRSSDTGEITVFNQPDCVLPKSFFEGRFPPNVHPESLDYAQWWDEQERRCIEGFSDGGFTLTGPHMYHLNFKKINMLDANQKPMWGHPYFSDEDQEVFNEIHYCEINGMGFMLITGRGFGKSYLAATFAEHKITFFPASEVIVSASTKPFVKNLWSKIGLGINSQPSEFRPSFLSNNEEYIETGYKGTGENKNKKYGYMSKMFRAVYDDDPGKTRGTRPNIHIFEEVGSWTGAAKLIKCYKMTEASWWRGSFYTCLPILIGTGGQMEGGASEDAKEMFWNPKAYNLKASSWDGRISCRFVPAYSKFEGTYERSGVSRKDEAKSFLEDRRRNKMGSPEMYRQETMEFPFTPYEAFQVSGSSYFNLEIIEGRYSEVERNPEMRDAVRRGNIHIVKNDSGTPIDTRWEDSDTGIFEVVELPEWNKEDGRLRGEAMDDLYISGCDSFDAVAEEATDEKSKGCCMVYKRFWKAGVVGDMFVAKITQRTDDATEFYWNTVKLNMHYNCKMLYEHTKIGIAQYYLGKKLSRFLYPKPTLAIEEVVKRPTSTNRFGIAMPLNVKRHAIKNYAAYLADNIENVYFASQLKDALEFNFGSNKHDETMAAAITLLARDDMLEVEIEDQRRGNFKFPSFNRDFSGKLNFS